MGHTATWQQLELGLTIPGGAVTYGGTVAYTHAGGIDAPLSLIRNGTLIMPHANWRGEYDAGTNASGARQQGDVDWPGNDMRSYFVWEGWEGNVGWSGSLLNKKRDESGLLYMRNRYFDPGTGRFTQEDPIGLAGGMNLYGFAGGDPVNFSDPFGLCWWDALPERRGERLHHCGRPIRFHVRHAGQRARRVMQTWAAGNSSRSRRRAGRAQADDRIQRRAVIPEREGRYLRVVPLADGETVHNAFFDRGFSHESHVFLRHRYPVHRVQARLDRGDARLGREHAARARCYGPDLRDHRRARDGAHRGPDLFLRAGRGLSAGRRIVAPCLRSRSRQRRYPCPPAPIRSGTARGWRRANRALQARVRRRTQSSPISIPVYPGEAANAALIRSFPPHGSARRSAA